MIKLDLSKSQNEQLIKGEKIVKISLAVTLFVIGVLLYLLTNDAFLTKLSTYLSIVLIGLFFSIYLEYSILKEVQRERAQRGV